MRILIAPDKYKGTLTAHEAAHAIARGVRSACATLNISPELDLCPLSDGGEGFLDIMAAAATNARIEYITTLDPLGEPINVPVGFVGDGHAEAIVESATIIGLERVPVDKRNPEQLTTVGVGTLLIELARCGTRKITIGLGGSATIDGGIGMASALGYRFLDAEGNALPAIGASLPNIVCIEQPQTHPLADMTIIAACDVSNPLVGEHGAARIYGPQKGATPEQIEHLDAGLAHLAGLSSCTDRPFAGAAGGLGFGLAAFAHAALKPGGQLVLNAVRFAPRAADAAIVLTGEGTLDHQSFHDKVCASVVNRAGPTPVIALPGALAPDIKKNDLTDFTTIHPCAPLDALLPKDSTEAADRLERAAAQALLSFLKKHPRHTPEEPAPS